MLRNGCEPCVPNQKQYYLGPKVDPAGYVYVRIKGALYRLKESGKIANKDIVDYLSSFGYHESTITPGLFKHATRNISFTLVVDDFDMKWLSKEDPDHLLTALEKKYDMKVDMESKQYVGIDLEWDYTDRMLTCSMDEYIKTAL